MSPSEHERIVRQMIEAAGHATQTLGVGRVTGQIFAYVYFHPSPRTLDDMTAALGISKGSASMCVRQLEQWGALEKIDIKGDRKDYYRARDGFGRIARNLITDLMGKRLQTSSVLVNEMEQRLKPLAGADGDDEFLRERIGKIRNFQKKAQGMWDSVLVRTLLK